MSQPSAIEPAIRKGPLPLVIGVTGHRNLRPKDRPSLECCVEEIFKELRHQYPSTPLILLSPLADGADRLAARVALSCGADLVVPMPMPECEYEKDFKTQASRDEFETLRGKAKATIEVAPPCESTQEGRVPPSGEYRDRLYARVGAYVARNCLILIALWDGVESSAQGGTAQIVRFKREGVPDADQGASSPIDQPETGPVYHIVTPRTSSPCPEGTPFELRKSFPGASPGGLKPACDNHDANELIYKKLLRRIEMFNRDALEVGGLLEANPYPLVSAEEKDGLPADVRVTLDRFDLADGLALYFQKRLHRSLSILIVLALLAAFSFQLQAFLQYLYVRAFPEARSQIPVPGIGFLLIVDIPYLIFLALACGVYLWEKSSKFHSKYLDYRALAEGLRVQTFWRLAGLKDSVADHYLRKQKGELDWIRHALRVWGFEAEAAAQAEGGASNQPDRAGRRELRLALDRWVIDQRRFFHKNSQRDSRKSRTIHRWERFFFLFGLALAVIKAFRPPTDPVIIFMGLAMFIAALLSVYAKIRALSEHAKRYEWMTRLFARAERDLTQLVEAGSVDDRTIEKGRELLREAGREALVENGDWVLLHRERPLELPHI